jgi:hypothetical protein
VRDPWNAGQRNQWPQPDSSVKTTKNLDTRDPLTIRQPPMDFVHELLHALLELVRRKIISADVREPNALSPVHPPQHPYFPNAQRTFPVKEYFDLPLQ